MISGEPEGSRAWLITGAGRGLGRAFASAALERGDRVVATARRPEVLDQLRGQYPGRLDVLGLDVGDLPRIEPVVDEAAGRFGRLDVVVNNAGLGHVGMLEEVTAEEAMRHFSVNLLGAVSVTRAALPHLRGAGGGDIVQISSTGGVGAVPGLGLYNAGKWALEGWSEALASEVAGFGIRVTIAELSGFATDWAGTSMEYSRPLPVYDDVRRSVFGTADVPWRAEPDGAAAAGDAPEAAAETLLAHLDRRERPLRLLVGTDASEQVTQALQARRDDLAGNAGFAWPG